MTRAAHGAAPLALTMGEPGGVGGEIAALAWRELRLSGPVFFAIDDPARLAAFDAPLVAITAPAEATAAFEKGLPVLDIGARVAVRPGVADPANAGAVIASIRRAVDFALAGAAGGVVTLPIQKAALIASGFSFPGHTEFLGALTAEAALAPGRTARGPVMMLTGPALRTVPVTVHMPLGDAVRALSMEAIVHAGTVTAEALAFEFGLAAPRLAVSGLNPHAGEGGALGHEDEQIIRPAVEALRAGGVDAFGPVPADTMFHAEARARYDAALCMYHDQALIPVKTLAFHETVNATLGLPIVRTSPDHGTALDIAGKGTAHAGSLIAAIRLAGEMARRRADASANANAAANASGAR